MNVLSAVVTIYVFMLMACLQSGANLYYTYTLQLLTRWIHLTWSAHSHMANKFQKPDVFIITCSISYPGQSYSSQIMYTGGRATAGPRPPDIYARESI